MSKLEDSLLLTKPLKVYNKNSLDVFVKDIKKLRDYEQVGSYNWLDLCTSQDPIIVIPGAPKSWNQQWNQSLLKRDRAARKLDENLSRYPLFPLEPLFQAVKVCREMNAIPTSFQFQSFDIATDLTNLRKLLAILSQQPKDICVSHNEGATRIDVQRIDNIICLIRCQEVIHDNQQSLKLYGKDFETKCTTVTNDMFESSFQQIVGYKLGELKFLVRFETHCADYSKSNSLTGGSVEENFSREPVKEEQFSESQLKFVMLGERRHYHFVELATRAVKRGIKGSFPCHKFPQMFFSGIDTLSVGWQCFGNVIDVELYNRKEVQTKYGGYPLVDIRRLHNFLKELAQFVRSIDEGRTVAIFWKPNFNNEIKIFNVDKAVCSAVPQSLMTYVREH